VTGANAIGPRRSVPRRLLARFPFLPAIAILALLLLASALLSPNSVSPRALTGLVSTYLALMLLAVAQTWVVFAGDIDLSAGAILSLVNVTVVVMMERFGGEPLPVLAALGAGLVVGAACGLVNGVVVAVLRLQGIVATFATGIFFTGLALALMPVAGTPAPALYWRTYGGRILEVPFVLWTAAAAGLLVWALTRTRLVLRLLGVGDGPRAAYQSGVPVTATRMRGYMLCGLFAALAAFCITGATASGDPLVGGAMTLYSVAAVVLGGTALAGGSGTVVGSIAGALIIGLINAVVYYAGTPSEWQNFVQGLSVMLALAIGVLINRGVRS